MRWLISKILIILILIPTVVPFYLIRVVGESLQRFAEYCVEERVWSGWLADQIDKIGDWGDKK